MALVALLTRPGGQGIGPGTFVSPAVPVGVTTHALVQLNAIASDWDSDPALLVSFTVESSADGGATWSFVIGGETNGGARSRNGALPSISRDIPPAATHVRGTLSLSKRFRLGLDGDLR